VENETTEDRFSEEVEDRLQDLFGGAEPDEPVAPLGADIRPHPLRDLKAVILSIDWEITDEVMTSFVKQVAVLQERYRGDKIVLVLLQLLGSIGEYIRTHLGRSHPDAFKLLNSLFTELETIVQSEDLKEAEKKKIIAAELGKYKRLKDQLVPPTAQAPHLQTPAGPPEAQADADLDRAGIVSAIEDLKLFVRKEMNALIREVKLLREEMSACRAE
jgi:hypothetical protein